MSLPHFNPDIREGDEDLLFIHGRPFFEQQSFRTGDRITYSQRWDARQVIETAEWANLHLIQDDAPCTLIVVRKLPHLPKGAWAINLNHAFTTIPTFGRVTSVVGPMVRLKVYDLRGNPVGLEPLDRSYLARIKEPEFPLANRPVWLRNGRGVAAAALYMEDWETPGRNIFNQLEASSLLCKALEYKHKQAAAMAANLPIEEAA